MGWWAPIAPAPWCVAVASVGSFAGFAFRSSAVLCSAAIGGDCAALVGWPRSAVAHVLYFAAFA